VKKYVPPWKRNVSKNSQSPSSSGSLRRTFSSGNFGGFTAKKIPVHVSALENLAPKFLAPKFGSLQTFVENIGDADSFGSSQFSVDDVHRIGVLDIRLCNLDRHLGNLLVTTRSSDSSSTSTHRNTITHTTAAAPTPTQAPKPKSSPEPQPGAQTLQTGGHSDSASTPGGSTSPYKLIPIDHAYILPDFRHLSDVNFEWLPWNQARMPFSAETLRYIESLNPFEDASKLKRLGLEDGSAMTLIITTLFLKQCASSGLNLWEIGSMIQRQDLGQKASILENAIQAALTRFKSGAQSGLFDKLTPPGDVVGIERSHRITNGDDMRWSRKLNVFLSLISEAISEVLGHYDRMKLNSTSGTDLAQEIHHIE